MITFLHGENNFELTKKVAQLKEVFDGVAERYDGSVLDASQLADIFAGQTLFATNRLIFIDTPSDNRDLWQSIETWSKRLSDDTHLVLIEPKPDKRTATYKWLKKHAEAHEFVVLKDVSEAARWLQKHAEGEGLALTTHQARRMISRAGTDQWTLAHAVDKLVLLDEVTDQSIDDALDRSPDENVFVLFDTALNADIPKLHAALQDLQQTEDPYRLLGLLNSQALQLATLIYGKGNVRQVAADLGLKSNYPLQKLAPHATRLGRSQAAELVHVFAETDIRLKSTDADPWSALEVALARIASL